MSEFRFNTDTGKPRWYTDTDSWFAPCFAATMLRIWLHRPKEVPLGQVICEAMRVPYGDSPSEHNEAEFEALCELITLLQSLGEAMHEAEIKWK